MSLPARDASAIPAFARKYQTSCTTCHVAIPKRNDFGEAFRRNGYVMPERDARLAKEKPVSLGAPEWKDKWPNAIWPGELPASFPLSAYGHFRFGWERQDTDETSHVEFDSPHELELVVGGAFGSAIGFFGEWTAYHEGENASGLKRLFVQFNDVAGAPNAVNVQVGRFEPAITDGYTDSQRLTLSHPITHDFRPAGGWRPRDPQSGIQLTGILRHRIFYSAGVVNGEGKTVNDATNRKDVYARVAYRLGGTGFDGPFNADEPEALAERSLTLGLYGYQGSLTSSAGAEARDLPFQRVGADVRLERGRWDLLGGILLGEDDGSAAGDPGLDSVAWFVEADRTFYPWLIGVLRFEQASADRSSAELADFSNWIVNATVLLRPNVRVTLEGLVRDRGGRAIESPGEPDGLSWVRCNLLLAF